MQAASCEPFGLPPSEVPPQSNSVTSLVTNGGNSSNRAASTTGSSIPTLGHMLFNLSNHDEHVSLPHPSPISPAINPQSAHAQSANVLSQLVLSQTTTLRNTADAELAPESELHLHDNHHFSHFLPASAVPSAEGLGGTSTDPSCAFSANASAQPQNFQQKQGNLALAAPSVQYRNGEVQTAGSVLPTSAQLQIPARGGYGCAAAMAQQTSDQANGEMQNQAQDMQLQQQLSIGLDQSNIHNLSARRNTNSNNSQLRNADPLSGGDMDQGEEGTGAGNRWPRQETLALLKIRADMDAAFRDTSVKRPLWDEVSRKLGELGYERSAKKCKEKFENVNKYYKRTKEGKAGRQDGKTYRFFTQLEALSANTCNTAANHTASSFINMLASHPNPSDTDHNNTNNLQSAELAPAQPPSIQENLLVGNPPAVNASHLDHSAHPHGSARSALGGRPTSMQLPSLDLTNRCSFPFDPSHADATFCSSSRSSSDDDTEGNDDEESGSDGDDVIDEDDIIKEHGNPKPRPDAWHDPSPYARPPTENKKRKRKSSVSMIDFFEALLKKVIDKQEQLQEKFLQAMEKRESDRMIREEAWRRQERARLSKEDELREQERSSAAARDAALIAFLQKVTGQTLDLSSMATSPRLPVPAPQPVSTSIPIAVQPVQSAPPVHQDNVSHQYDDHDLMDPSSKRWLKPEVLHLIELHRSLQTKFIEAGPKGPLWEEIANGMAKRGYPNRTAKRCKEKWENINKYFKRAKESNKKRPDNAKTCPYFQELDALYKKGLGSSNMNQQPYKPSIEHAPQDENINIHLSPMNDREGDFDHSSALRMLPVAMPSEGAAVLEESNASAIDANNNKVANEDDVIKNVSAIDANNNKVANEDDVIENVINNNGTLQSLGSMPRPMAGANCGLNEPSKADYTSRSGFLADLGLSIQHQSSTVDMFQQKPLSQAEPGKVMNAVGSTIQSQLPNLKEIKPTLAPLPNTSSFMTNILLQKLSSTDTHSNPQDH